MTLLNTLRRKMFWYVDSLKGAQIQKHYSEIVGLMENPLSDDSKRLMELNLTNLLDHATSTTPFYRKYRGYESLQDFHVIDKTLIREHYQDFKSVRFKDSELFETFSSGSTGIPFGVLQDMGKRNRNTADVIYFLELAGGVLGDKLFFIKLWDHNNKKGKLTKWLQNIHAHNVMDSSKKDMEMLMANLEEDSTPKSILVYPSFFEELCNYLNITGHKPKVKNLNTIISFAESLKSKERFQISCLFDCQVYERYSNQENGIFAQKTVDNPDDFVLNLASYHFEVLEMNSDEHVKPGEVGRLVVTDLFNYAMPMIRYDTGDMVIYERMESGRPYISSIFGRRMDTIFDTKGKIVSPHVFYLVVDYGEMEQFQFVQVDKDSYLFIINGNRRNIREDSIVKCFKQYLGEDALISFEYVNEIPLLSSGKRKKIVNEYKKS